MAAAPQVYEELRTNEEADDPKGNKCKLPRCVGDGTAGDVDCSLTTVVGMKNRCDDGSARLAFQRTIETVRFG